MAQKSKNPRKILKQEIAVIGIGRVGLPLAIFLADKGHKVWGLDVDQGKINLISSGKMPFMEEGAEVLLKKYLNKSLRFSTNYSTIAGCDVVILTLGTPVDENMNPSMVQIDNALKSARDYFKAGQLLILRSTVSPGTTSYVKSYLNDLPKIEVGRNFFLAFCPERIAEGRSLVELDQIPQIIGGVDRQSSQKASLFLKNL